MKLLYACDIHTNRRHLKTLLNIAVSSGVNAVAIGGDVTPKVIFDKYGFDKLVYEQRKYLEDEFVPILRDFKKAHTTINLYLDLGNDDFKANRDVLEKHEGELFHLLHMTVGRLTEEIDIVGFMDVPVTPFTIKDWEKADKKSSIRQWILPSRDMYPAAAIFLIMSSMSLKTRALRRNWRNWESRSRNRLSSSATHRHI